MLAVYDSETRGVTQATSRFYQHHSTIVAYQIYPKTISRGVWILQCRDIYVNAKMWSWVLVSPSAWFEGWSIPTPGLKEIPAISLVHLDSEDARIPRKYQCNPIVSLVLDTKGCYKQQHVIHGIQWDPIVEEKNTYLQFMWWIRIQSMSKRQWISVKSWALFLSMAFHGFITMFPNLWMFHTLGVNPLRQTHRTVINRNSMRATSRSSRLCFSEVWNPPFSLCLKP